MRPLRKRVYYMFYFLKMLSTVNIIFNFIFAEWLRHQQELADQLREKVRYPYDMTRCSV